MMRALTLGLIFCAGTAMAAPGDRLAEVVTDPVRDCAAGWNENMPLIAWGADGVVAWANGGSLSNDGGKLGDAGLPLELSVVDSFEAQLRSYLACETPFLRGTLGMLASAAPVTEFDARTEQIVFFKHSFSAGDGIVAAEGISRIGDLWGKRIAIQANGPQVDFVGRILADGVARRAHSKRRSDIEYAMEEGLLEVLPNIERRTPYLATFANIATLLGLLGTIIGLIAAFTAVANADPAEKATLLSQSISIAMNTTAFGLMAAIPLLLIHSLLQSKTSSIVESLEIAVVKALNLMDGEAAAAPASAGKATA